MVERYKVTLQANERAALEAITRKGSHRSRKVINALILLNCDGGACNRRRLRGEDVAEVLKVSMRTLDRVKKQFVEEGLETLLSGQPSRRRYRRKADGELEARLVALSCSEPPKGYSQWSLRLLADRAVELDYIDSISHETVRRVLKKRTQALAENRLGDSTRGQRRFRRRDGTGARRPSTPMRVARPVVCMDETPRQLIRETRTPLAPRPGRLERHDYEYERCGVCNVFMATEPLARRRLTKVTERKTKID